MILFNIIDDELVFIEYVWRDWCFESEENLLTCIEEKEEFDKNRLSEIYALALEKAGNRTQIIVNETEKLVLTGSIDDELYKLYSQCVADKTSANEEFLLCTGNLNTLIGEKTQFESKLKQKDEETLRKINETMKEALLIKGSAKQKIKNWLWFAVIVSLIGVGIWQYKVFLNKNNCRGLV